MSLRHIVRDKIQQILFIQLLIKFYEKKDKWIDCIRNEGREAWKKTPITIELAHAK